MNFNSYILFFEWRTFHFCYFLQEYSLSKYCDNVYLIPIISTLCELLITPQLYEWEKIEKKMRQEKLKNRHLFNNKANKKFYHPTFMRMFWRPLEIFVSKFEFILLFAFIELSIKAGCFSCTIIITVSNSFGEFESTEAAASLKYKLHKQKWKTL